MPKADIDGAEIHYEIHGEGTPVLLIAGLGGTGSYWRPQVAPFAERFQVILHDHRGTGQSSHDTRIRYSIEQMTADLVALMDALEVPQAHLVGHSTGGAIAQVMAIEHPERVKSIVLYASWTRPSEFLSRVMAMRKQLALQGGPEAYASATPVFLFPHWWIDSHAEALEQLDRSTVAQFPPAEIAAARCDAVAAFDREQDLHRISTPTLVVCARDDFLTPLPWSERLASLIPDAAIERLEKGGHACSVTMPEDFNRVVLSFLEARERGDTWPPAAAQ